MKIKRPREIRIEVKNRRYKAVLKWDFKDNAYIIKVPALPEVFTFGRSLKEVKHMAKDAIELYLVCQNHGS
ncbi:MAG TPA: type II toxin-antitoxin system HicB family antitoxin [Candidatus Paceibacterota bacterium]